MPPNQANHSMSFGGDSDGSGHKNSDEDELLNKIDKISSPKNPSALESKRPNERSNKVTLDQKMFDSVRNVTNASRDTNMLNYTGSFLATVNENNNRSMYTDPGNVSNTMTP